MEYRFHPCINDKFTNLALLFCHLSSVTFEEIQQIADHILAKVKCRPKLGIICGSGLGKLADMVEDKEVIPYNEIPGFPVSTGNFPTSKAFMRIKMFLKLFAVFYFNIRL